MKIITTERKYLLAPFSRFCEKMCVSNNRKKTEIDREVLDIFGSKHRDEMGRVL